MSLSPSCAQRSLTARLAEVVRVVGPLGFTAFGGTAANIVLCRRVFVVQEAWTTNEVFTDLFALGSGLPGPAFIQLAFSIVLLRAGYLPAFLSVFLLAAPGAFIMLGIGFAVQRIPATLPPVVLALFSGLNSAAVALVAVAAFSLSKTVITDKLTRLVLLASACIACCYESQWLYPVMMVAGGGTTCLYDWFQARRTARKARSRTEISSEPRPPQLEEQDLPTPIPLAASSQQSLRRFASGSSTVSRRYPPQASEEDSPPAVENFNYFRLSVRSGLAIIAGFFAFLITILIVRAKVQGYRALDFGANLALAGTILFGGGPVVVPLLRGYTVDPGWVTPRDFLLGFAIIQALPGPLFNFAVFLGVLVLPQQPVLGGLLGFVAIFSPGIFLKIGVLPVYNRWQANKTTRSVLRGLNATAVGLIFSAVFRLFRVGFISPSDDPTVPAIYRSLDQDGVWIAIAGSAFVATDTFNLFPPFAIVGGAVVGIVWWAATQQ